MKVNVMTMGCGYSKNEPITDNSLEVSNYTLPTETARKGLKVSSILNIIVLLLCYASINDIKILLILFYVHIFNFNKL